MLEHQVIDSFRTAIARAGMLFREPILADGRLHRVRADDDRKANSWYVLHDGQDRPAFGAFGCWKRQIKISWCASAPGGLNDPERERFRAEAEAKRRGIEEKLHAQGRRRARGLWQASRPATPEHPYLQRKGIAPFCARVYKGGLVLPLVDLGGEVHSLQFITPDGEKRFLSGAKTRGLFCPLGSWREGQTVFLAEGFATAATIHAASGAYVLAAFSAGNLQVVAKNLREKLPDATIVICADNDAWTHRNPGIRAAEAAAEATGAHLAVPNFADVSSKPTDFNDLALLEGMDAVRQGLDRAAIVCPRPKIEIESGRLHEMVDEAEGALLANSERWPVFQRSGIMVHLITLPGPRTEGGIQRPAGSTLISPMGKNYLRDILNRAAIWVKAVMTKGGVEYFPQDCPRDVAEILLERSGHWRLPPLLGIIQTPTLRPDGSFLIKPGYDEATGLFLHPSIAWPPIPGSPTKEDAEAAVRLLRQPFGEFPFVGEEDIAVVLAAILTALIRLLLPTAPMMAFSSPMPGTGKGLLADIVALIATGRVATAMPQGGNSEEELRKRIITVLLAGDPVVNIDNVEHPLSGDTLCSVLTQLELGDRLLGHNKRVVLPTKVLWLATGNNITFAGDMVRRGLICRIDSGQERPDQRRFTVEDLRGHVLAKRPELVSAALTILRAYHVAGRPRQKLMPYGSFEEWSARVREPLVWLGLSDPCLTRERLVVDDPVRESIQSVLEALFGVIGDSPFTLKEILVEVRQLGGSPEIQQLRDALSQVATNKGGPIEANRLAWWCRHSADRPVGGLKLVREPKKRHNVQLWRVVPLDRGGHEGQGGDSLLAAMVPERGVEDMDGKGSENGHPGPHAHPLSAQGPASSNGAPAQAATVEQIKAAVSAWPARQQAAFRDWVEIAMKAGNSKDWAIQFAYERTLERKP